MTGSSLRGKPTEAIMPPGYVVEDDFSVFLCHTARLGGLLGALDYSP